MLRTSVGPGIFCSIWTKGSKENCRWNWRNERQIIGRDVTIEIRESRGLIPSSRFESRLCLKISLSSEAEARNPIWWRFKVGVNICVILLYYYFIFTWNSILEKEFVTEYIFFWYSFSWKNEWGITTAKWTLDLFPPLWNILNKSKCKISNWVLSFPVV